MIIALCLLSIVSAQACTTAIVSGRCTPDGRPILFKNRDTGSRQNKLMYFSDGDYDYIGVVSVSDTLGSRVWSGVNSAGFAIMNSLSYNMNFDDTTQVKDKDNGTFMKLALERCATLADFERLLEEQPKPLGVQANFGVIDAHGGAAYYEAGHYEYTKIDANDPSVAPFGYIIRTNYSATGPVNEGHGYIRYLTAENLFYSAVAVNDLSARFIVGDIIRCLKHSLTKTDLWDMMPRDSRERCFVPFEDFIPRLSTASSTVVHGVREGEPPELSTMWTILGFPLCSVAFPTWVAAGDKLPEIAAGDEETGKAPLGVLSFELRKRCFPITRGSGARYLDLSVVLNEAGTGYLQQLAPIESEIMDETDRKLSKWREKGFSGSDARKLYKKVDKLVTGGYERRFGLKAEDLMKEETDTDDQ